jgi:hypothetical protein
LQRISNTLLDLCSGIEREVQRIFVSPAAYPHNSENLKRWQCRWLEEQVPASA